VQATSPMQTSVVQAQRHIPFSAIDRACGHCCWHQGTMLPSRQARSGRTRVRVAELLLGRSLFAMPHPSSVSRPLPRTHTSRYGRLRLSRLCRKLRIDGASRSVIASGDAVTQLASKGSSMAGSSLELDAFDLHASRRLAASSLAGSPQQWSCASGKAADAPQRAGPAINDSTKGQCCAAGKQGLPAHGYGLRHCCSSAHCSRCRDLAQSPGRCLART